MRGKKKTSLIALQQNFILYKMKKTAKVIFNTGILYLKVIITTVISLVSVPIILNALGSSDYGIYNLVAGVIAMLAFLNSSMSVSTQRYMSVAIGEGKLEKLNDIYNNAIALHFFIALFVVVLFEFAFIFLFDGMLNIPSDRIFAAEGVYQMLVISMFFTIMSVPFGSVMNAKEDMIVFAFIDIIDAFLKLVVAFHLASCQYDRLMFYGLCICAITLFTTISYFLYVKIKYKEFSLHIIKYFNKTTLQEMLGFAGWNSFGAIAVIGRNQGIAIIINHFFGTIANAAYGIANQINGVLLNFSATFQRAINPQLMQSEGRGDRSRMVRISIISSKFSTILLSAFALPLIIEMPFILQIWLKNIPEYSIVLSQLVLLFSIISQYSVGLMSSIQATGDIKRYQHVVSGIILLNIPLSILFMVCGLPIYYCMVSFIIVEILSFAYRLYKAHKMVKTPILGFIYEVVIKTIVCCIIPVAIALLIHYLLDESFIRFIVTVALLSITYLACVWFVAISKTERDQILLSIKINR